MWWSLVLVDMLLLPVVELAVVVRLGRLLCACAVIRLGNVPSGILASVFKGKKARFFLPHHQTPCLTAANQFQPLIRLIMVLFLLVIQLNSYSNILITAFRSPFSPPP
ncbi:MAG: hypothetical protein J3R72DRAFT_436717 [Linnemannia gamsii]|nr:MAG: hypothetical protein J3R72DRAFT_436717 [Linnemannia gamsii]